MTEEEQGNDGPEEITHQDFRLVTASSGEGALAIPPSVLSGLLRNGNDPNASVRNCEFNAIRIILALPAFNGVYFDAFLQQQCVDDGGIARPWAEEYDTLATAYLQRAGAPSLRRDVVCNALAVVARQRVRNVLKGHLQALPPWDGTPRLEHFWIDVDDAPDDEHHRAAGRNAWIALVGRGLMPGCEQHEAYVLEGDQGIGKNELLKAIGGPFYRESRYRIGSIDFLRTLRGAWVYHLPEFAAANGTALEIIKSVLSSDCDTYPEKYERHARTYPRSCVIFGSTNSDEWLTDPTGNRRFIPIKCKAAPIRVDLVKANREHYLAEAMHRLAQGARWHEFPHSTVEVQSERVRHDVWDKRISEYAVGRDSVSIDEVLQHALGLSPVQMNRQAQTRASSTLRKLGWRKAGRTRIERGQTTVYVPSAA